jgi:hypothetical protein
VDDRPLRPSSAWYWVAGILAVVGVVGAIVFSVVIVKDAVDSVDDWPRVSVPGSEEVVLDAGGHTLYLEYPGAGDYYTFVDPPDVEITDPDGDPVVVMPTTVRESYSWSGHSGVSFARFHADSDGLYEVEVRSEPRGTQEVAIGEGIDGRIALAVLGGMAIGGLSVLVALIIAIVTAVRRGKEKRRRNPPPAWNPPPPGAYGSPAGWGAPYPGTYPQPGWGAPPPPGAYPQPGWGAPPPPGAYPQPGWGAPPPPGAYPAPSAYPQGMASAPPPPGASSPAPPPAAPTPESPPPDAS